MENLEDDTATPDLEVEVANLEQTQPINLTQRPTEIFDDSVVIVEQTVDLVDLTSPQPSTSQSAGGTLAVGSLLKTQLEETLKDVTGDSLPSANLDQNPSSSSSSSAAAAAAASTAATATTNVLECPICLQTCIHPARLPCGHIFCFLCVKGVAYKNRRCAMCRREIPPEFLDHPQLVNGIEDICTTKATDDGYQWFYEGRNGGWWAYEKRNAFEMEEAYQRLSNKKPKSEIEIKKEEKDVKESKPKLLNPVTVNQAQVKQEERQANEANVENEDDDDDENEEDDDYNEDEDVDVNEDEDVYDIDEDDYVDDDDDEDENNGWWQYDDRTSQDLEEAFKKGERSCTILVAGYVYIVDFDAMIQQRQNEPARCRRVKRDLATIPKKGVAGLRIEGNTVTTDSNFAAQVYQSRQNRYRNGELLELLDGDLEISDNSILRTLPTADSPSANPQGRLRLSYGGLGGYVIELGNPSEFVSTAAATDAALRIASDIIGSTLAHADELTRSNSNNQPSTSSSSAATTLSSAYNQQHNNAINNPDTSLQTSSGELSLNDLTLNTQLANTTSAAINAGGVGGGANTTTLGGLQSMNSNSVNLSRERGSRELLGAAEDLLGATQRVIATADQPTIDLFEQTLNDFHALTLRNIIDSSDDDNEEHTRHHHHHHHHQHTNPANNAGQRPNNNSNNQDNP